MTPTGLCTETGADKWEGMKPAGTGVGGNTLRDSPRFKTSSQGFKRSRTSKMPGSEDCSKKKKSHVNYGGGSVEGRDFVYDLFDGKAWRYITLSRCEHLHFYI